jgi:hypothetical protein
MIAALGDLRKRYRKQLPFIVVVAVILVAASFYIYRQSRVYVPPEFLVARDRAVMISGEIVSLTNESAATLDEISAKDRAGRYSEGLDLVLQDIHRNSLIRSKAADLAEQLRLMALGLNQVKPSAAAAVGLQAVTSGSELVQRLVNYNNYTYELLNVLRYRLERNGDEATRFQIEDLITKMNNEAKAVNDLNQRYRQLIGEFDQLTR